MLLKMPPPYMLAVLPDRVELTMLRVPLPWLRMPPASLVAELPEMVEL